ncbi:hypothetical protein [Bacteroides congonensis]|nr:hypothetical protein [Bacteroides congonensis]
MSKLNSQFRVIRTWGEYLPDVGRTSPGRRLKDIHPPSGEG